MGLVARDTYQVRVVFTCRAIRVYVKSARVGAIRGDLQHISVDAFKLNRATNTVSRYVLRPCGGANARPAEGKGNGQRRSRRTVALWTCGDHVARLGWNNGPVELDRRRKSVLMCITYDPLHPRVCSTHPVAHDGRSIITWAVACNASANRRPTTFRPNMLVARWGGGCGTRSERERVGLAASKEQSRIKYVLARIRTVPAPVQSPASNMLLLFHGGF